MISRSKWLLLISIIFCASVFAQDIQSFEINGLKVILKQNSSNDIISANMYFKGGVTVLTEDQAGLENLTLVVAQKATENYPKEQLNAELESMNSQINSNSNQDYSSVNLLCVKQNFEKSWNIFSDIILNPLFSEEDLNLERDKIIANVKQINDNPDAYLQKLVNEEFYIDHPYSVSVNGTETTLSSFTKKDLSDFYSRRLKTSDMLLVVVGNVTKSELEKKVSESFGNLDKGNFQQIVPPEVIHAAPSIKIVDRDLPTNYIQGTYSAPSRGTEDGYTMLIMNSVLRDRVWEEVRTKRSLSYAPSSFYRANFSNYGAIYVSAVDPDTTIKVMIAELEKLKNDPISDVELRNKIRQFITFYYLGIETNQAQANILAFYELSGIGYKDAINFLNHINKITPEDIRKVAQKYIKNLQFVLIGNPTTLEVSSFMY
jgi:zinc protease